MYALCYLLILMTARTHADSIIIVTRSDITLYNNYTLYMFSALFDKT